jgi:hypothetical protein
VVGFVANKSITGRSTLNSIVVRERTIIPFDEISRADGTANCSNKDTVSTESAIVVSNLIMVATAFD